MAWLGLPFALRDHGLAASPLPCLAGGAKAFRIRNRDRGVDVVLGHVQRVYVAPGERVRAGQMIARAGKLAAPDGCHLHFETRPVGDGYLSAVHPHPSLMLSR